MDIVKWTNFGQNSPSSMSSNEDLKGHENLLHELDNQYINKER